VAPARSTRPSLAARAAELAPFRVVEIMQRAWAHERDTGERVVSLCVGEPGEGTPEPGLAAARRVIDGGQVRYTPALGTPALRAALSAMYAERYGVDVPAERICVTVGASGALYLALAATIGEGERLLLADPGYPCNRAMARILGSHAAAVPVGADSAYQLTATAVAEAWRAGTAGVLAATPSNPTGTLVEPAELAAIADVVDERGGVLVVDEIYGELVYGRPARTVLADRADAFVVNSFSKTFGMTGWRIGWLVCPAWAVRTVEVLAQNLLISPPTPSQAAALGCLCPEGWAEVERRRQGYEARRDLLVAGLRALGFGIPVVPDGAFYVYADCSAFLRPGEGSEAFCHRMIETGGVAITPGTDFGDHLAERHVRCSYAGPVDDLVEGLERLRRVLG
jgi:aspartate/methionine/tyrosine aminotransferase